MSKDHRLIIQISFIHFLLILKFKATKVQPRAAVPAANSRPTGIANSGAAGAIKKANDVVANAVSNQQIEELSSQVCVIKC